MEFEKVKDFLDRGYFLARKSSPDISIHIYKNQYYWSNGSIVGNNIFELYAYNDWFIFCHKDQIYEPSLVYLHNRLEKGSGKDFDFNRLCSEPFPPKPLITIIEDSYVEKDPRFYKRVILLQAMLEANDFEVNVSGISIPTDPSKTHPLKKGDHPKIRQEDFILIDEYGVDSNEKFSTYTPYFIIGDKIDIIIQKYKITGKEDAAAVGKSLKVSILPSNEDSFCSWMLRIEGEQISIATINKNHRLEWV